MKLTPCPACATPLSPAARACPHCGHVLPRPAGGGGALAFFAVLGVVALIVLWLSAIDDSKARLRSMEREGRQTAEDIRAGTYREPVKVRLVR